MPSRERNDSTMGIEAPQPIITGGLLHSVSSAREAARKAGAFVSKPTAGDPPSPA